MMNRRSLATSVLALFALCTISMVMAADMPPQVGDPAPDFELASVTGAKVKLSKMASQGPVVLIVLRGFPGYQCPLCNRQMGQYLAEAEKFKTAGAQVLFVYPGPSEGLVQKAKEFVANKTVPDHFQLLIDPDYMLTNAYHLRWDAEGETAYPSTFVIQKDLKVAFRKVSQEHGGRTKPGEVLGVLMAK
jgi:peroxiredoxin Q/BCP